MNWCGEPEFLYVPLFMPWCNIVSIVSMKNADDIMSMQNSLQLAKMNKC